MNGRWRFHLLGRLEAQQGERIITRFHRRKTGALLGYLAFYLHRSHPREILIDQFWPELEPAAARHSLSMALSSLRRQLEPPGVPPGSLILADRSAVQLSAAVCSTDVAEFEAILRRARETGSDLERTRLHAHLVDLYRGELLPGYYESWILPERQRLAVLYLETLTCLAEGCARSGNFDRALDFAHRALVVDPLREESHELLMRLLVDAGRPSAALGQYEELRRTLEKEFAISPTAAAGLLSQQLAALTQQGFGESEPSVRSRATPSLATTASAGPTPVPARTVTYLVAELDGSGGQAADAETWQPLFRTLVSEECTRLAGWMEAEGRAPVISVFENAHDALGCAVEIQRRWKRERTESDYLCPRDSEARRRSLTGAPAPARNKPGLRMALHTGIARHQGHASAPSSRNHAVHLARAAHGDQILCSEETAALLRRELPAGLHLIDLGFYRVGGIEIAAAPERVFQVDYPGRPRQRVPPSQADRSGRGRCPGR
jgi:DNA-binding SARP family transcriptional activator